MRRRTYNSPLQRIPQRPKPHFTPTHCLAAILLFSIPMIPQQSKTDDEQNAIMIAKKITDVLSSCPRREIVAQFKKHWVKEAWGPPTDVSFDVERTNSIVNPFKITIEFSLSFAYGPERNLKADAQADTELKPLFQGRYRNSYSLGQQGAILRTAEVRHGSDWAQRPRWPDACWDSSEPAHKP